MEDKIKDALKLAIKSVTKLIISKVAIFAIPIIVFIIAIAIAMSIGSSLFSNSGSSTGSANDATFGSGMDQFIKWYHKWEDDSYTGDEKYYTVKPDGGGGYAVGFGVDIATHGAKLIAAGYSTEPGSQIPVDVVDAIEKEERNEGFKDVQSECKDLNLTNYQIYALVSRYYNCGPAGWKSPRNGLGFVQSYKTNYNMTTDDKYGNKDNVDYSNKFYTNFMKVPNTSGGVYVEGVQNRRNSEWLLFQTGYFDRIDQYCNTDSSVDSTDNTSGSTSSDINLTGNNKEKMEKMIARAIEIADDVDYKYYTYSQSNRLGPHSYDCSGFCYSLYKKYFDIEIPNTTSDYGSKGYIGAVGSVELKPGDILWRSRHVELYIGNNKRAGAHTASYPKERQISIETGGMNSFSKVYRFIN